MTSDPRDRTYPVCGVPITAVDQTGAVGRIVRAARAGDHLGVHLCNAYTLSLVGRDMRLRQALKVGYNIPDGVPVARMGRRLGQQGPVRGSDLVAAVCKADSGLRHYFYGGGPGVAAAMGARLQKETGAKVAGAESPPFGDFGPAELAALAERVQESKADVVWVGLGTPKQDYLVADLSDLIDRPVVPVGAAFDFWAGKVREAPAWLHGTGLEWAHRLLSEPGRLWKRYLVGNPQFLLSALRHELRERRSRRRG